MPQDASAAKSSKEDEGANIFTADGKKHLAVVLTTDRGLCGGVNSSLSRMIRKEVNLALKNKANLRIITLGDKGRAQIARDYIPLMAFAVDQAFEKDPIFPLAAALASKIVTQPFDLLTLFYNHYENQAKFVNTYRQIPQMATLAPGAMPATLKGYDVEPPNNGETLVNLQEYAVASALFYAMLETVACETSQRVIAMDNATTNAKDMVHSLSLIYNRGRQSKITTELTESESKKMATATRRPSVPVLTPHSPSSPSPPRSYLRRRGLGGGRD